MNVGPLHPPLPMTRRRLFASAGLAVAAIALSKRTIAEAITEDDYRVLRARPGLAHLRGNNNSPTPIWGYDGISPGPTLRVKHGDELKVRLVNDLHQSTTVHWHGLRLPNSMDGVPHLTQAPIEPGLSFDYRFTPPDAGTFWYHTHFGSSEQLARGLYGVLIVDERKPIEVDRDLILVIDDWRLQDDGTIQPSFGNFHDAMMAGRLGQYVTVNSEETFNLAVRANERLRLRIVNTANSRIFLFRIAQHSARVMAVDGQPCTPDFAPNGLLRLAPGNRIDLFLDATLEPGSRSPITVDDLRGSELEIGQLVYDAGRPIRNIPLKEPEPLPDNPLSANLDIANALQIDVPLDGGGMGMMMGGMGMGMMGRMRGGMGPGAFNGFGIPAQERIWALASVSATGHDGPPIFKAERGRTVVLNFFNRTAFPHAMHIHGHHFRHLNENGKSWKPFWLDTVVVDVQRAERVAFVADNPGRWMIHCHMIEHMATGMAAWFQVT